MHDMWVSACRFAEHGGSKQLDKVLVKVRGLIKTSEGLFLMAWSGFRLTKVYADITKWRPHLEI
tara:strand:+ start:677 stop:868 length:192 start_codon:yes stop_codon:yes gene_type:complete